MNIKLIWITPDAEKHVAYCARVSSPHQDNPEYDKLIAYLIKNKHWSPLEMASMCVEITTSRAISAQILRHRSFSFQEFSQRYATATEFETYEARSQDLKNRQNSIDNMSDEDKKWFKFAQGWIQDECISKYKQALERGIAKEQARFLLPLSTQTKLYMSGTLRSWAHYLELRTSNGTQLEHAEIAKEIQTIFIKELPIISKALDFSL